MAEWPSAQAYIKEFTKGKQGKDQIQVWDGMHQRVDHCLKGPRARVYLSLVLTAISRQLPRLPRVNSLIHAISGVLPRLPCSSSGACRPGL